MTLDEIVIQKQDIAKQFLDNHKCDDNIAELMMMCIKTVAHEAWYQGRVAYAHEDLPEILRNHHGPF